MIAAKTYLTGGNGSRHDGESFGDHFEFRPTAPTTRRCAAIASFHWSWRLLLATGDAAVRRPHGADPVQRLRRRINTERG